MLAELDDAFTAADADSEINCIVFAGAGSDLSSGHNLSDSWNDNLNEVSWDHYGDGIEDQLRVEREFSFEHAMRIRDVSTSTVANVNGNSVLAGIMLADVCDLVVDCTRHEPASDNTN